jgi:hypothetical protein
MPESNQLESSSISGSITLEEMVEFWDTHDTADCWDQFEEVEINVTMPPRDRIVQHDPLQFKVKVE